MAKNVLAVIGGLCVLCSTAGIGFIGAGMVRDRLTTRRRKKLMQDLSVAKLDKIWEKNPNVRR